MSHEVAKSNQLCYTGCMAEEMEKFYWHSNTSSGGTLSISLAFEGMPSQKMKERLLAHAISECHEKMEANGYIPFGAQMLSSRDIADKYGKSRQYWEKLLNEGKIRYKETSAGRITTDLWVTGYIKNKEEVDKYVKDVNAVLELIDESGRKNGAVACPACGEARFEFHVNVNDNTNGICRACGFYVHTTK